MTRCLLSLALLLASPIASAAEGDAAATPPAEGAGDPLRYRHQTHDRLGVPLTCAVCHGTTAKGQPTFPGAANHSPCANAGCHADDFADREPALCRVCHTRSVPWGDNPIRRLLDGDEFAVRFSHASHLGRAEGGALLGKGCASCHPAQAGAPPPRPTATTPAPGHARCASCHLQLARPHMDACDACHIPDGDVTPAGAPAADDRWRVAARFSHEAHTRDPRTAMLRSPAGEIGWGRFDRATAQPLDCVACHAGMARVDADDRAARPTKADCAQCHQGTYAFKVTGFRCARCHGPAEDVAIPTGGGR
ncbi:MAG: cytochrome c3 family protein [Myxococcales bacterium]|nr:cytochrome c3 family protein [Myxococcales bacterium]